MTTSHRRPSLLLPATPVARGTMRLPGSKSISNRALLLAALAEGTTRLPGLLQSDDTKVMQDALSALGIIRAPDDEGVEVVVGQGGHFPVSVANLFVGNSGLTMRTLLPVLVAALAKEGGSVTLSGTPRMHERPIGDLVDGLRQLGAKIDYLGQEGFPPLRVTGVPLKVSSVRIAGSTSSQFLTGILQAAPLIARDEPLVIEVEGELISQPYVAITLGLMARFGVIVMQEGMHRFTVLPGQSYSAGGTLVVEGDASTASYFLAMGAIGGDPVKVMGAGSESLQGDVRFADALEKMGAVIAWEANTITASGPRPLRGLTMDCSEIPDAAMTLAMVALYANGPTHLSGIGSWRVKETDRIAAMATELRKLGAVVEEGADYLKISPPAKLQPAEIGTYDDHRMAMCFSLPILSGHGKEGVPLTILDPDCVAKTFPEYWIVHKRIMGL